MRRFQKLYLNTPESEIDPKLMMRGEVALARMETWLSGSPYLVAGRLSLADISLLAYTRLAHEGGFDLAHYPGVLAWVKRVDHDLGLDPAA